MFGRRKKQEDFDRENLKPVIMASICTGEKVAGFVDVRTKAFKEVMLIKSDKDIKTFAENYGLKYEDINTQW